MSADRRDEGAAWPFVGTVALTGIFVLLLLFTLYLARPFLLPLVLATILNFLLSPVVRVLARLHVPPRWARTGDPRPPGDRRAGHRAAIGPAAAGSRRPRGRGRIEQRVRGFAALEQVQVRPRRSMRSGAVQWRWRCCTQEVKVQGGMDGGAPQPDSAFLGCAVVVLILLYFLLASGDFFLRSSPSLPLLEDKRRRSRSPTNRADHLDLPLDRYADQHRRGSSSRCDVGVGMPNPALWGVLAGLLNYVPYLGSIVTLG